MMLGAVIGDMVGSRFERAPHKSIDFALFTDESRFTDDTVCTVAVADWLMHGRQENLSDVMQRWCQAYPDAGYGGMFQQWIMQEKPQPYYSWGNGSAMRVSAVGWLYNDLTEALSLAEESAAITHNHPEGIKGAQAIAAAIFWARKGEDKAFICRELTQYFGYDLSRSCEQIRPDYAFDSSCQGSVPQAMTAFLDSHDFEHAVRLAVSLGGDSDTLAAMAGSIAEAYYRVIPEAIVNEALQRLPEEMRAILARIHTC